MVVHGNKIMFGLKIVDMLGERDVYYVSKHRRDDAISEVAVFATSARKIKMAARCLIFRPHYVVVDGAEELLTIRW